MSFNCKLLNIFILHSWLTQIHSVHLRQIVVANETYYCINVFRTRKNILNSFLSATCNDVVCYVDTLGEHRCTCRVDDVDDMYTDATYVHLTSIGWTYKFFFFFELLPHSSQPVLLTRNWYAWSECPSPSIGTNWIWMHNTTCLSWQLNTVNSLQYSNTRYLLFYFSW